MAREDVEAFRRGTELINAGDPAAADEVHEDAVFEPLRAQMEGAYIGREGMLRFLRDTEEAFEMFTASYPDVQDLGNGRLLAIGTIRMRGRGSAVESDVVTAAVVEFRDGLMARYKDYGDPRLAKQAAFDSI
jgi:ketosteroid isomerase-like protein